MSVLKNIATLLSQSLPDEDAERSTVAQVISIQADKTSVVRDDAGREFVARGDSVPVGQNALVSNGQIQQAVPALPFHEFYV